MKRPLYSILPGLAAAALWTGCSQTREVQQQSAEAPAATEQRIPVAVAEPVNNGPAFDVTAVIRDMGDSELECGKASDVGIWVVTRVRIPDHENVPPRELLLRAAIMAKQNISEWMNTEADSATSLSASQNTTGGKTDIRQELKTEVKTKSVAFMRGVSCCRHEKKDGYFTAWYCVTGRTVDSSSELEAQLRAAPPGVVRATGIGMIVNGKLAPAMLEARQAALQSAVEQVMGTTVIGQSQLMDNSKAKAKLVSQTVGNIKEYRVVKEGPVGPNYIIVMNVKVDEQQLLDNYAALVRSMGNPGFAVKCQDPDLKLALSDFFATLGFKVTENPADTQFVVDADCKYIPVNDENYGEGIQIDVLLNIFDVTSGQQLLFAKNTPRLTSTYSGNFHQIRQTAAKRAFKTMKKELHVKLNKLVMDWVLNGRTVKVVFYNLPGRELDEPLSEMINHIPCAKFMTRNRKDGTLELICSYVGPAADFEEFLRDRLQKDLPRGTKLPATESVGLNRIEFCF